MTVANRGVLLVSLAVLSGCAAGRPSALQPFTPDGRVLAAEWQGARRTSLGETGTLRMAQQNGTLHLALEDGADGIASVFLYDGERVYVLHASAALGTAVFERSTAGRWLPVQDFTYAARNPDDVAAREAFRRTHGWLANVTPPGSARQFGADREFLVDLAHFRGPGPLRFAAGYLHLRPGAMSVDGWPADLQDGVTDVPLHQGHTQGTPVFTPERWPTLPL
jgi:hypothetical protein